MSDAHEVFQDRDAPRYYRAELTAGGVKYIAEALRALNDKDMFCKNWEDFEARCKDDHWSEA